MVAARDGQWFDQEMEKLDRWAEDKRTTLKGELDKLDDEIRQMRREARVAPTVPEKLRRQRELRQLEARRNEAWRAFDQASQDVERQKDTILDDIGRRLEQRADWEPLFTLRWHLI